MAALKFKIDRVYGIVTFTELCTNCTFEAIRLQYLH